MRVVVPPTAPVHHQAVTDRAGAWVCAYLRSRRIRPLAPATAPGRWRDQHRQHSRHYPPVRTESESAGLGAAPGYTHAGSGSLHRYQRRPARRRVTTPDHAPPPKPTGIGAWLGQEAEKVPGQAVFEPGSVLTRMCWPWCSARHNAARRSRGAMRIPSGPSEAQGRLLDSLGPSDPCVG